MTGITDASIQTVFRPGAAPDPSNVLYTVEIINVAGTCDMDKKDHTADANLDISFRVTRPPSGGEAHYSVPYFIAVTEGTERILARRNYSLSVAFGPGQTTVSVSERIESASLRTDKDKQPYDYQVLVGLQLSKDQLEYNRRGGHYGS
ncbi:MAG TPA: hypothetical protein VGI20_13495 [Rhizomicrobium sp.]|jgi:hypothetical protein